MTGQANMTDNDVRPNGARGPLVSVVLATYNRAGPVGAAITSVLNQSLRDLELIVVDDCSTDDTRARVAEFDDSRLRFVRLDKNRGVAGARNAGIEMARGIYITMQDSDCVWHDDMLEVLAGALGRCGPEVIGAFGAVRRAYPDGSHHQLPERPERSCGTPEDVVRTLRHHNVIDPSVCLLRLDMVRKAGLLDRSMRALDDWEWFLRLSSRFRFLHVPRVLQESPYDDDCLSLNDPALYDATRHIVEEFGAEFRAVGTYRFQLFQLGLRAMAVSRFGEARSLMWRAVVAERPLGAGGLRYLPGLFLALAGPPAYRAARRTWRFGRMLSRRLASVSGSRPA